MQPGPNQPFADVLATELDEIDKRRKSPSAAKPAAAPSPARSNRRRTSSEVLAEMQKEATAERAVQQLALQKDLLGLALSGGGIRSATFCLGVLQALARCRLLRLFDYLSTVSGGGYIGSWLACWIKREGSVEKVEQQLHPNRVDQAQARPAPRTPLDQEPEPIYHLRAYSSYLAPRRGLFSADSWVLLASYARNILLNQLVLFPAAIILVLGPRLLERLYNWGGADGWNTALFWVLVTALAIPLLGLAISELDVLGWLSLQRRVQLFHGFIIIPLVVFALVASWEVSWDLAYERFLEQKGPQLATELVGWVGSDSGPGSKLPSLLALSQLRPSAGKAKLGDLWWRELEKHLPWDQMRVRRLERQYFPKVYPLFCDLLLFGTLFGVMVAGLYTPFAVISALLRRYWSGRSGAPGRSAWFPLCAALSSAVAGFSGGALFYLIFAVVLSPIYDKDGDVALITTMGAPLVMLILMFSVTVLVGLMGIELNEEDREWWASFCGWLSIWAAGWLFLCGLSLVGPWMLLSVSVPALVKAALGSGWLTIAGGAVGAGWSKRTGTAQDSRWLDLLARVGLPVFLAGMLAVLALGVDAAQSNASSSSPASVYFAHRLDVWSTLVLVGVIVACVAASCLAALRVDVNAFSLQGLYANRLIRCYLGASRPKAGAVADRPLGAPVLNDIPERNPDPITGFDPADDLELHHFRMGADPRLPKQPYFGPYLLLNTALNLTEGDELAWQDRKADGFVMTPHYCGSSSTGYGLLDPSDPDALRLGMAVALSGAAVSPNMGYHSSAGVTALLTIFNVRLGGWVRNPRFGAPGNSGPKRGLLYFFNELFGRTNNRAPFVYLSDGGHFDNLGIYELVRRRCRLIIACDSEDDHDYTFGSLASVMQKCRTDFGINIDLDVERIRPQGDPKRSKQSWAVGTICYQDVDRHAKPGVLLYLKSSLTCHESSDVLNYAQEHPPFPHQTTLDQFFTESQFESYRMLGYTIASNVFGPDGPAGDCPTVAALVTKLSQLLSESNRPEQTAGASNVCISLDIQA